MQIVCTLQHETISDVDRAGRPYTLALTHYHEAETGQLIRTRGRVINTMSTEQRRASEVASTECERHDAPAANQRASDFAPIPEQRTGEGSQMLSWKLMKATEAACQSVCMGEEAADHYGYTYSQWGRWADWWRGFVAGWVNDEVFIQLTLTRRIAHFISRR
ncbi:hypothetical protein PQQ59_33720 [Paraburkholderia aspalathi]|uniref:hypothetical protein n=1 Tax=Paraburkholderia aspalathi TaxID=1324617 RepID=UPI0038BCDF74